MYELILYATEHGQCPMKKYLATLIKQNKRDDLVRIYAQMDRLKEYGMSVNHVYPETIRKLEGDIYELRPDNHRIIFFYHTANKMVLLHAFKKQHGKAPVKELERARREIEDYKRRYRDG